MKREEFIASYVATFLASHAALIYAEVCATGRHERFDNQPVEDARCLAEKAWEQLTLLEPGLVSG